MYGNINGADAYDTGPYEHDAGTPRRRLGRCVTKPLGTIVAMAAVAAGAITGSFGAESQPQGRQHENIPVTQAQLLGGHPEGK